VRYYRGSISLKHLDKVPGRAAYNKLFLLEKLSNYGIRGPAHELLSSYLSNRKQCTNFHVDGILGNCL
jgi:hypothetical protein